MRYPIYKRTVSIGLALLLSAWAALPISAAPDDEAVVVKGVGLTADEARADALRRAVFQIAGGYVDAESLVRNDQLIHDKVLTASDGYVERAEALDQRKRADGLVEVSLRVTVRKSRLRDRLKEFDFSVKDDFVPEIEAEKVKDAAQAREMLSRRLPQLRRQLLRVRVVDDAGKPIDGPAKRARVGDDGYELAWNLKVQYDDEAYADEVAPQLRTLLDKITAPDSNASGTVNLDAPAPRPAMRRELFADGTPVRQANYQNAVQGQVPKPGPNQFLVLLNVTKGGDRTQQGFRWYVLDRDPYRKLFDLLLRPVALEVTLTGADGKRIAENRLTLGQTLLKTVRKRMNPDLGVAGEDFKMYESFLGYAMNNHWGFLRGKGDVVVITPEFVDKVGANGNTKITDRLILRYRTTVKDPAVKSLQVRMVDGATN